MRINPLAVPTFAMAAVLFWIGEAAFRRVRDRTKRVMLSIFAFLLAVPGLLYVLYYAHLFDGAAWFYNLRAVPLTELLAGGMGLFFGCGYSWMEPDTLGEKVFAPIGLFVLLFIPFMKPVVSPINLSRLRSDCEGEVCLQSTESSCGPASAATLLRSFGLPGSEKELAKEAFTYRGGTENWYLARALRRWGLSAEVKIRSGVSAVIPAPSIAGVLLPGGAGHFIAVLSNDGTSTTIVDPLTGKIVLPNSQLPHRYHFTGFFLVVSRRTP